MCGGGGVCGWWCVGVGVYGGRGCVGVCESGGSGGMVEWWVCGSRGCVGL